MDNYKLKVEVEPTDDYQKAKLDFIQAINSIGKLPPHQRQKLMEELFGMARVAMAIEMFRNYFG